MLSMQAYKDYLASLVKPQERPVLSSFREDEVKRFPKFDEVSAWFISTKLGAAIDRMVNAMQIATDNRPEPEPDELIPDELDAPLEGVLITVLPDVEQIPLIDRDPKQWAANQLVGANSWDILHTQWENISGSEGAAVILDMLIKDAMIVCADLSAYYADTLPNMGAFIVTKVADLTKSARPADLYRKFASSLRWARDHGNSIFADFVLSELMEGSTLPFAEMEAPAWIDGYTGEIDPKEDFLIEPKSIPMSEQPDSIVSRLKSDLGYTDVMVSQFLKAQESFNSFADEEEIPDNDHDTRPMSWDEEQEAITPSFEHLRADYALYAQRMRDIARQNEEYVDKKDLFLNFLQHASDRGTRAVDLAGFFVSKQNAWDILASKWDANRERIIRFNSVVKPSLQKKVPKLRPSILTDEDAQTIIVDSQSLDDIIEFYDVSLGDGGVDHSVTEDLAAIERFSNETLALVKETCPPDGKLSKVIVEKIMAECPEYKVADVYHHPQFVEAFLRAMIDSHSVTEKDDEGNWTNLAVEAGWEAWRQHKNPTANAAYHFALTQGMTRQEAMQQFWKVTRAVGITNISAHGLTLTSGRFVDWRIAAMKLKGNEIALSLSDRARLKDLLVSKKWGAELSAILA